jgi:hypothetical protein
MAEAGVDAAAAAAAAAAVHAAAAADASKAEKAREKAAATAAAASLVSATFTEPGPLGLKFASPHGDACQVLAVRGEVILLHTALLYTRMDNPE